MADLLNDFQKWAVGEYFGHLHGKDVVAVNCMSPMEEGGEYRIYVRFRGYPHPGKVVLCSQAELAKAEEWWPTSDPGKTLRALWYRPMVDLSEVPCMWCGEHIPVGEVDAHEQQCGN